MRPQDCPVVVPTAPRCFCSLLMMLMLIMVLILMMMLMWLVMMVMMMMRRPRMADESFDVAFRNTVPAAMPVGLLPLGGGDVIVAHMRQQDRSAGEQGSSASRRNRPRPPGGGGRAGRWPRYIGTLTSTWAHSHCLARGTREKRSRRRARCSLCGRLGLGLEVGCVTYYCT